MKEFKVMIPDEDYEILNFTQEELPGVAIINAASKAFEPKQVFSWHLSIMIYLKDLIENGMPSRTEEVIVYEYGILLDENIKGQDKKKPNALFLARITWNKTRELIWRVFDPEITNTFLRQIISENSSPRPFDFRIDSDDDWELAKWHLSDWP